MTWDVPGISSWDGMFTGGPDGGSDKMVVLYIAVAILAVVLVLIVTDVTLSTAISACHICVAGIAVSRRSYID